MNEKEKKAIIYFDDILTNKCDIEFWKRIKNLIKKQEELCKELLKYPFEDEWFLRDRIEEQIDLLKELLEEN